MYAGKRRQRNFKRVRTLPNGQISAKCAQDIRNFAEYLHGHAQQQQQQQPPANVSNPSKRHRERLNGELETVASLLPYEEPILQRLDKLSVLRLAVAFLQIKAHFQVCAQKASLTCDGYCADHPLARFHGVPVENVPTLVNPQNGMATLDYGEMQFKKLAQKALGAFLLAIHLDGDIFYVTESIEVYLGFQQSDLLHQSLFEMIHSEDRDELRALLQNAMEFVLRRKKQRDDGGHLDEADWSFSLVLRFRCLLDHSCGFSRAEFRCRLISVHSHRVELSPFVPPLAHRMRGTATAQQRGLNMADFGMDSCALANSRKYALVSTCTPFVPPPLLDFQFDDPILKSRHSLDLGFQSLDLRFRCILEMDESPSSLSSAASSSSSISVPSKLTLYSFVHPDDLKSVAEAHETAIKCIDAYLMVYRLISSNSQIVSFVQSKLKLFVKNGRPDRIEVNHRILTEIDGESLLEKKNSQKLKNCSFDDTLLLSPRNQQHNQQQQVVIVGHHCPVFQQSDLLDATDTELIPTAAFSPPAKAIFTTIKTKKGKKMGRKGVRVERTDSERNGTSTNGTGRTNVASSVPSELAFFPSSSTAVDSALCLPSSHFEHFPSVSSSSLVPPRCNVKDFAPVLAPFQQHGDHPHPPAHLVPHPSSHSHPLSHPSSHSHPPSHLPSHSHPLSHLPSHSHPPPHPSSHPPPHLLSHSHPLSHHPSHSLPPVPIAHSSLPPPSLPPPPPSLPSSSDSVLANNCPFSPSLSWPNSAPILAPPSHANAKPRLKRTQFTFERYYAETVDLSPYGCYYYCPSSSASSGALFPQNVSPMVDFSSGIYPTTTGADYWNSMLAMAANPTPGGGDGTDCYGRTAQQQQQQFVPLASSPLLSADPSAHFSLQFQQQFSPAWLNAAGSVFSFAAAASQFWPCAVDFDHTLAHSLYANDGHSEGLAENGEGTETNDRRNGIMGGMAVGGQPQGQCGERGTTTTAPNDDRQWYGTERMQKDGQSEERGEKRADGAKNATDTLPLVPPAQSTPGGGFLHASANATTVSNASGFRFLSEMAQTLFG